MIIPKSIHPFPARMAPDLVMQAVGKLGRKPSRILDPMAGSGTSLVAAKAHGHWAIGYDTDPLAVIIAKSWTENIPRNELKNAAHRVIKRARKLYGGGNRCPMYPEGCEDAETREFIRYWFDDVNRRQLAALSRAIRIERLPKIQNLLWCSLSRLIIAKARGASLALDLAHSRPHRALKKPGLRPLREFQNAVEFIIERAPFMSQKGIEGRAEVKLGDARHIRLPSRSVDLVLTSPPYLNAIDYVRCHKFSLVWMGWSIGELRKIKSTSIGSEVGLQEGNFSDVAEHAFQALGRVSCLTHRYQRIVKRYIIDLEKVVFQVSRVLKPQGSAIFVIGESSLRGVRLRNGHALEVLAKEGNLRLRKSHKRAIPAARRYLPPPMDKASGSNLQRRLSFEIVMDFRPGR